MQRCTAHKKRCGLVPRLCKPLLGNHMGFSSAPDMAIPGGMAKGAAAPTLRCMAAQSPSKASREPIALPR